MERELLESGIGRGDIVEGELCVFIAGQGDELGKADIELGVGERWDLSGERLHGLVEIGGIELKKEIDMKFGQLGADEVEIGLAGLIAGRLGGKSDGQRDDERENAAHCSKTLNTRVEFPSKMARKFSG